jgi:hypothetical protein
MLILLTTLEQASTSYLVIDDVYIFTSINFYFIVCSETNACINIEVYLKVPGRIMHREIIFVPLC